LTDGARSFAVKSGIVPADRVDDFLKKLAKKDFTWVITDPSRDEPRQQGDILDDIPVCVIGPNGQPFTKVRRVMILNPICDLQPGRAGFVTVTPIRPFATLVKATLKQMKKEKAQTYCESVRANKIDELFYLPTSPQLGTDAVVFLNQICSVRVNIYEDALKQNKRKASLTQDGYFFLLAKISRLFIRPE
jgi:hypothetical protein